jgi:hypothetical protein
MIVLYIEEIVLGYLSDPHGWYNVPWMTHRPGNPTRKAERA